MVTHIYTILILTLTVISFKTKSCTGNNHKIYFTHPSIIRASNAVSPFSAGLKNKIYFAKEVEKLSTFIYMADRTHNI